MNLPEPDGRNTWVTEEEHNAVKALGNDPAHKFAVDFIIKTLCGRNRMSFVAGAFNHVQDMAFFEGRRFPGEMMARMIERAWEPPPAPPPPIEHLTATERARRRAASGE